MPHRLIRKLMNYPKAPPSPIVSIDLVSKEEFDEHVDDENKKRRQLEARLRVIEAELPAILSRKESTP